MLWADALCINQSDDQEKPQQVSLMGGFYKIATAVLISLGEDILEYSNVKLWKTIEKNAREFSMISEEFENAAELIEFLNHHWFKRAWTLQEVILARRAVLICGSSCIDWRLLTETVGPQWHLGALEKCTQVMQLDSTCEKGNLFKDMLLASAHRDATDSKDRIYSLLSLLFQQNNTGIRADYIIPSWELNEQLIIEQI
jgi:hypothetical protein